MNTTAVAPSIPREELVGLHTLFDRWIGAMRSHEAYEEGKLYPYLEHRWSVSLDSARAGHEELHVRADAVAEGFRSLARPADPADPDDGNEENPVLLALQAHDRTLDAHRDTRAVRLLRRHNRERDRSDEERGR